MPRSLPGSEVRAGRAVTATRTAFPPSGASPPPGGHRRTRGAAALGTGRRAAWARRGGHRDGRRSARVCHARASRSRPASLPRGTLRPVLACPGRSGTGAGGQGRLPGVGEPAPCWARRPLGGGSAGDSCKRGSQPQPSDEDVGAASTGDSPPCQSPRASPASPAAGSKAEGGPDRSPAGAAGRVGSSRPAESLLPLAFILFVQLIVGTNRGATCSLA